MEYLALSLFGFIALVIVIRKRNVDSSEAVTGFIKHMIEKNNRIAHYQQSIQAKPIEAFAEELKKDYKGRMDPKLFKRAHWITIAEWITDYVEGYQDEEI